MTHRPLRIAFYTEGLPFDGRPIEQQSIGGSESALWFMARALATRGHEVTVFNLCDQPGVYDGVTYRPAREAMTLGGGIECDVWIVSRFYPALAAPIRANLRWLWLHDVPAGDVKNQLGFFGAFADQVMPLSDYHEGLVRGVDLGKDRDAPIGMRPEAWKAAMDRVLWQTRNGVDLELLRKYAGRKNPKRLLFASRPERGLDVLLNEIWPRLRAIDPALELHVASYDTSRMGHLAPELRAWYGHLDAQMAHLGGCTNHGSLTKQGFYALLGSCQLLLAPTRFPEVSCIAAMEAMAVGVPVVATHDFALPETIPYGGITVEGDALPPDPAYVRAFVDRTVELLRDETLYHRLAAQGRAHIAQRHQWKAIAQEWEARAYATFDARVATRGRRICEGLLYSSAVVAAHAMAQELGYTDLEVEAAAMLSNHHSDPDDYDRDGAAQRTGWDLPNTRWALMAARIPPTPEGRTAPVRVLDVGTGAGGFLGTVLLNRPDLHAVGVDFSPSLVAQAQGFLAEQGWAERGSAHVVDAERASVSPDGSQFEVVCAGEVLEHMADPASFIAKLEAACVENGVIILSVPAGPWESASFYAQPSLATNRPHIQDFRERDLRALFGKKANLQLQYVAASATARNEPLGWWIISYLHRPGHPTGQLDYASRWWTERPFERVALTMIVKDGANDIRRCLESVIHQVDEVVIAIDDRTTDTTREILREFEGRYWPKMQVLSFTFEDFSQARNVALAAVQDADWILWMDADETLHGARQLRNYLQSRFYEGFGIEQHHLVIDFQQNMRPDRPIRLFRADRGYQFYGLIHEDPGLGINAEIQPALVLPDVRVLHHGYVEEELRRQKAAVRNLPLVRQDGIRWPERAKGPFLRAREYMNLALWRTERAGGRLDEQGVQYMREAVLVYLEHYATPGSPFHEPAFEVAQRALQLLAQAGLEVAPGWGLPFQVDYICRGRRGGQHVPGTPAEPIMRWFSRPAELWAFLSDQADAIVPALEPLAGLTRRTTVLAPCTAQEATGEAVPPSHAHDAAAASDTSCKDADGCTHAGSASPEAVSVSG